MKKIIILIAFLLLTGCQATYNIEFNKDKIKDDIKIYVPSKIVNSANNDKINETETKLADWQRGHEFYKRELYTTDEYTGYNYTYEFNYKEYDAMSEIRKCYDDFNLTNDNNQITLKTSNEFLCATYYQDVTSIEINISTEDYTIINSNADIKNNNKHTWKINKSNYSNKPIEIKILKKGSQKKDNKKLPIKEIITTIVFIISLIILIKLRKVVKIEK